MAIRSPGYPSINLEEAIQKAAVIWNHDKRNATMTAVVASHWKYQPTSSGFKLALAALKKFGLIDAVGNKKSGQVKLSQLAQRIILDQVENSAARESAIKEAALNPGLHRELWDKYGHDLPSDANVKTYLILERGFNDATVGDFLKEYKETISFAKLGPNDKITGDDSETAVPRSAEMSVNPQSTPAPRGEQWQSGAPLGLLAPKGSMLPLPFPLIGGGVAMLHIPVPMSKKNFDYLTGMIGNTLKGMEEALVRDDVTTMGEAADEARKQGGNR